MREQPDFTEEFEEALSQVGYNGANLDRIETRACASDDHDGVEYTLYGSWVPVRPIIDVMAEVDDFAIESISHIDEGDPKLNVFVADLRTRDTHPAFVGTPY